ncbi:MAG: TIGR02300 family protein, partial [Planctomycetota bacterium]|nr:TIGR02300 family protein [Planctomycetota bacterium]
MAKPKWGIRRHCRACEANFYDLNRAPIICPKCNAEFNPETFTKPRRARAVVEKKGDDRTAQETVAVAPAVKTNDSSVSVEKGMGEGLDDDFVEGALDEKDEEKVFVPSEELEAEPEFEPDSEEDEDQALQGRDKLDKASGKEEAEAGAKTTPEEAPKKKPKAPQSTAAPKKCAGAKPLKKHAAKSKTNMKKTPAAKKKPPAKNKTVKR